MRFQVKPFVVEARQWKGPGTWMIGATSRVAQPTDWIVKDSVGHFHIFTDEAFQEMFELYDYAPGRV